MRRLSMKLYVPLLWGVCVWFAVESMTSSIPENRSTNVTAEGNYTTRQPTTTEVQTARWNLMLTSEGVSAAAEKTVSKIQTTEKSDGIVVVTTVAAATNSSRGPAPMEEPITRGVANVSTVGTAITSEAQPSTATTRGKVQPYPAVTTATTDVQPSTAVTTTTTDVQPSTAVTTATTDVQPSTAVTTTTTEVQHSTAVTTTTTEVQPSTAVTMATDEAQSPHYTTDTTSRTSSQPHHSSASIFTENLTLTTIATTDAVSSQQPTSLTGVTSEGPSTTSLKKPTQNVSHSIQDTSNPTPSSPTSEEATIKLSSTSQSVPKSTTLKSTSETARPTLVTTNSPSSTTFNSTSAVGILIPRKPERLLTTTKPAPAATPCETSKNSPSSEFQPCSTRGMAKQCLIIIAILAVLATVFMVSTIILCVKLSARRPKVKKQQGTEMMCISALLPERTPTYTRHRNPVSNGVLVLPGFADSDEEGGDNVTLSSFLPDNERYL